MPEREFEIKKFESGRGWSSASKFSPAQVSAGAPVVSKGFYRVQRDNSKTKKKREREKKNIESRERRGEGKKQRKKADKIFFVSRAVMYA